MTRHMHRHKHEHQQQPALQHQKKQLLVVPPLSITPPRPTIHTLPYLGSLVASCPFLPMYLALHLCTYLLPTYLPTYLYLHKQALHLFHPSPHIFPWLRFLYLLNSLCLCAPGPYTPPASRRILSFAKTNVASPSNKAAFPSES